VGGNEIWEKGGKKIQASNSILALLIAIMEIQV
jgi:hypothetical protein